MDELLRTEAANIGVYLSDAQCETFMLYMRLLAEYNKKMNLTAITDEKNVIIKHFIDSLSAVPLISGRGGEIIDVGSGAGFPGIPIAIALPDAGVTLLDATQKKVDFLHEAVRLLGLKRVTCIRARAEEAGRFIDMREQYGAAVARAVAPLDILAEYCLPFVIPGGFFYALKGPGAKDEIKQAEGVIEKTGGAVVNVQPAGVSDLNHVFVIIKKIMRTPPEYPREYKKIAAGKTGR